MRSEAEVESLLQSDAKQECSAFAIPNSNPELSIPAPFNKVLNYYGCCPISHEDIPQKEIKSNRFFTKKKEFVVFVDSYVYEKAKLFEALRLKPQSPITRKTIEEYEAENNLPHATLPKEIQYETHYLPLSNLGKAMVILSIVGLASLGGYVGYKRNHSEIIVCITLFTFSLLSFIFFLRERSIGARRDTKEVITSSDKELEKCLQRLFIPFNPERYIPDEIANPSLPTATNQV